jgi:hypothetical protein
MVTSQDWVSNSFARGDSNYKALTDGINILTIVVAVLILVHSFVLHGRKCLNSTRVQTDIACHFALFTGLCYFISTSDANETNWAVTSKLLSSGLFSLPISLCDNYMFLSRLKAVKRFSKVKNISIHVYIYTILVATWLPFFTIVPIFTDTNSSDCFHVYYNLDCLWLAGSLAYNFYFTVEFLLILKVHLFNKENKNVDSKKFAKLIAIKSIGHAITSSIAHVLNFVLLFFTDTSSLATPVLNIILILGMHFWFNCDIEKSICLRRFFVRLGFRKIMKIYISMGSSRSSFLSPNASSRKIMVQLPIFDEGLKVNRDVSMTI